MRVRTALTRSNGAVVATGEHLYLHVDDGVGRVTAMPADRWEAVEALLVAHAALDRPAYLGRGIGSSPGCSQCARSHCLRPCRVRRRECRARRSTCVPPAC